jgi:hypothetical protein
VKCCSYPLAQKYAIVPGDRRQIRGFHSYVSINKAMMSCACGLKSSDPIFIRKKHFHRCTFGHFRGVHWILTAACRMRSALQPNCSSFGPLSQRNLVYYAILAGIPCNQSHLNLCMGLMFLPPENLSFGSEHSKVAAIFEMAAPVHACNS